MPPRALVTLLCPRKHSITTPTTYPPPPTPTANPTPGFIFGPKSMERLAKAIATAHAAGVPKSVIAPAEAALAREAREEEAKVSQQVSQLVSTLDKLQSAGKQARLAQAGLASAVLSEHGEDAGFLSAAGAAGGKSPAKSPVRGGGHAGGDGTSRGMETHINPHGTPGAGPSNIDFLSKLDSITEYIADQQSAAKVCRMWLCRRLWALPCSGLPPMRSAYT